MLTHKPRAATVYAVGKTRLAGWLIIILYNMITAPTDIDFVIGAYIYSLIESYDHDYMLLVVTAWQSDILHLSEGFYIIVVF